MRGEMRVVIDEVHGIRQAIRWMRYAKQTDGDSRELSMFGGVQEVTPENSDRLLSGIDIGPRDKRLARALLLAPRDSHAKMCRVIWVWMDVTAPFKWWKQFDTYKVGTTALSTSTMNNIMDGVLGCDFNRGVTPLVIDEVKRLIALGDEQEVFDNLPGGYLQLRGVNLNYQVLRNIWLDRRHHKLGEWRVFLDAVREGCPYADELIFVERKV
jgi:hypothetical protein